MGPKIAEIWAAAELKFNYDLYTRFYSSMYARIVGIVK